jgi:hypothetical protein
MPDSMNSLGFSQRPKQAGKVMKAFFFSFAGKGYVTTAGLRFHCKSILQVLRCLIGPGSLFPSFMYFLLRF